MKTINTVKLLKEQKQNNNKNRKDKSDNALLCEKIQKYIEVYVRPQLLRCGITDEYDLYFYEDKILGIIVELDSLDVNNDETHLLSKEEIGFLHSSDTKVKKKMGIKLADYVMRTDTLQDKEAEYKGKYLVPILNKLASENIIIYDNNALDNKTKLTTNRINKLADKFIEDNTKQAITMLLFENLYGVDYVNDWDFLYSDNKERKKEIAEMLYDYIKENIDNIDLKNIDNIDFAEYTGSKFVI